MRKLFAIALIVTLALSANGCYTMKYNAPAKTPVALISEGKRASFKQSKKVWFALWGAVPISDNSSAKIIAENNLKQVRVTTKISFVDYLIGSVTGIVSIVPATMTVEGNE